jgi:hypothetical protein
MGPLPATVYRRRRWVAIASVIAVIAVIVLLVWGVAAFASAPDEPGARPASRVAVSAPQEASPPPAAPDVVALPSGTPPSAAQPTTAPQPGAAGSTPPTPSTPATPSTPEGPEPAASTGEQLVPDNTPPTSSPAPAPPIDPVPCTNEMLAVRAEVDGAEHRVGQRTSLRLVVTNRSKKPCMRDLDPVRQEIVVLSADGSQRLWSSNDCSSAKRPDLRTLVPGEPLAFSVQWAGRTSAPGCPARRETVPAGEYRLLTRVDDVISSPTQFVRVG